MKVNTLGRTDLKVSSICLGTMTWGEQNTEAEAWEQMDYATEKGINFFDTAELYPVPRNRETQGLTEEYIGTWMAERGNRDDLVIASKVCGLSQMDWFREKGEPTRLNRQQITYAVEQSLNRLKTDYIDLYQLHWPDRPLNLFNESRGYSHIETEDAIALEETLEVLRDLVAQGKIRYVGQSNETAWGMMKCLHTAETGNLPRVETIQNAYNLLNRLFEQGLAEVCMREDVALLAYSPLAGGSLSGKYLGGALPAGSRQQLFPQFVGRYRTSGLEDAIKKYCALAEQFDISPVSLALKFVESRPFVGSTIIGATTMAQLSEDIAAFDLEWTEELESAIEKIHLENPDPAP